jgi:hypothetical protein
MFKLLIFLKRRPGMSLEEFREYYESVHSKLGEKYSRGARRYVRRYLQPFPAPLAPGSAELDFDVVTELWYDDRASLEKDLQFSDRPDIAREIEADEERVFDRSKIRYAAVVECDSDPAAFGKA